MQFKILHPLWCMAFAKLSLVEIFKAKLSCAFSGRVLLMACGRAVEEEILLKIQEAFGDFCTGEAFLDVLLSGRAKVEEGLWGWDNNERERRLTQENLWQEKSYKGQWRCLVLEDCSADCLELCSNHFNLVCSGAASKPLTKYTVVYDILFRPNPYFMGNGVVLLSDDSCL